MRAILVCVNYWDYLAITLPWNKHWFDEVLVVTSSKDYATQQVCVNESVEYYVTDSFYDDGAVFNKWKGLEEGLDYLGREGWLCIMDADVLWPRNLPQENMTFLEGRIYTPFRRMLNPVSFPLPPEKDWKNYPRHNLINEFSGYTQIFHADDPVLGEPPWHEVNWKHAGGADTYFSRKWNRKKWVRPRWEVLHLGQNGWNWYGRASEYLDGSKPEDADKKVQMLRDAMKTRRRTGNFDHEKIK